MRARTVIGEDGVVRRTRINYTSKCGKFAYATKKLARSVAKQQARLSGENLQAYHCYRCHAHHIGNVPDQPRRLGT